MKNYENKVAVVTGAGGTLCSEIAKDLAVRGVRVVLVGRTLEKLEKVAEEIRKAGGTCLTAACDVADREAVARLAETVDETFGGCDWLINGAGGNNVKAMPTITSFDPRELTGELPEGTKGIFGIDSDAFESVLRINTMGSFYPIMAFAPQMVRKGGGAVVNFASMNSYCPLTRCFAYAMSKAAISNLTQSLAAYFAPAGIRINAVAPGFMVNERSRTYLGTVEEGLTPRGQSVIGHTPMGRFGEAKDLLGCVRWLLDQEDAAFVTGITVPVDGGFLTLGGV
ncbi:MAG: SDR family NAD(P)-dependent oxidoreductase [Clostridia bacterium]|nr:SDR family NAD(P)-dependent oxidoreductase [Clostridia bacterium]